MTIQDVKRMNHTICENGVDAGVVIQQIKMLHRDTTLSQPEVQYKCALKGSL